MNGGDANQEEMDLLALNKLCERHGLRGILIMLQESKWSLYRASRALKTVAPVAARGHLDDVIALGAAIHHLDTARNNTR